MDRRLLNYYNRELQHIREMGAEFAREFPKIAGRLTLGSQVNNLVYATGDRLQGVFQVRPDLLAQVPTKEDLLAKPVEKTSSTH